jgi:hypothetical protein
MRQALLTNKAKETDTNTVMKTNKNQTYRVKLVDYGPKIFNGTHPDAKGSVQYNGDNIKDRSQSDHLQETLGSLCSGTQLFRRHCWL